MPFSRRFITRIRFLQYDCINAFVNSDYKNELTNQLDRNAVGLKFENINNRVITGIYFIIRK